MRINDFFQETVYFLIFHHKLIISFKIIRNAYPVSENFSNVLGLFCNRRIRNHLSACLTVIPSFELNSKSDS